ncbi:helix-turn-helix domain-containing protein [Brucellaceae bacterium D45D]
MQDGFIEAMGRRLGKIRKDSGLRQIPFAEALGVSQSAYNTYEKGSREIPAKMLRLLYLKFNVNPIWILTGEGNPYHKDTIEIYKYIVYCVEKYFSVENIELDLNKKSKLIQFLLELSEDRVIDEETIVKYLRSII